MLLKGVGQDQHAGEVGGACYECAVGVVLFGHFGGWDCGRPVK